MHNRVLRTCTCLMYSECMLPACAHDEGEVVAAQATLIH